MKRFESVTKNSAYFLYRLIVPVFDPIYSLSGIKGYLWYLKDLVKYKSKSPKSSLINMNIFPVLHEKVSYTPFDAHYYHQQLWAFEKILKSKPKKHYDIASTYEFSGYISKITNSVFIDYRPIVTKLKNLEIMRGDILNLPLKDNSIKSLSCLHVIEHIGLGRYGDPINPNGSVEACRELDRVLDYGGFLYFSTPIGREAIYFNAHRVHSPASIISFFPSLKLLEFSVVTDDGEFIQNTDYKNYSTADYACGLFIFTKIK
jgi:SAM-dependent methyltransferase